MSDETNANKHMKKAVIKQKSYCGFEYLYLYPYPRLNVLIINKYIKI